MFEVARYVPVLHARLAEQRAYRELPSGTKDLIFPLFVARPWPNANSLSTMWDRIQDAVAGRRFGLDLDITRRGRENDKPAQREFDALFEIENAFENYYEAIAAIDGAVPVLRSHGNQFLDVDAQLARIQAIGRGGFVRIQRGRQVELQPLYDRLGSNETAEIAVVVDVGWGRDILQAQDWALQIATAVFEAHPEREIVICGGSFPSTFQEVQDVHDFQIFERTLFTEIRQRLNANLFYGDWGSTRPPSLDNTIMKSVPRIDLPQTGNWRVFRSEKYDPDDANSERETYPQVAVRTIEDLDWENVPQLWGSYIVECTAHGLSNSIRNAAVAAAARVNIHLHVQAHFDRPELMGVTDEPYED